MTVICTLLTSACVVHATYSYIHQVEPDGTLKIIESQKPKIVAIRHFRGAISFCGIGYIGRHRMLDWLSKQAEEASRFETPDEFAGWLCQQLDGLLGKITCAQQSKGIGLHFTVFESLKFGSVPELFWITNWNGAFSVQPKVSAQRQTIITVANVLPGTPQPIEQERMQVRNALNSPHAFLRYNNGDPELFNRQANAIVDSANILRDRQALISDRLEYAGRLALMPVESVSRLQRELSPRGTRRVGGRNHQLIITPNGEFSSNTGMRNIPGT
jgi:hypothetical protein